jgi:hypothetical protein
MIIKISHSNPYRTHWYPYMPREKKRKAERKELQVTTHKLNCETKWTRQVRKSCTGKIFIAKNKKEKEKNSHLIRYFARYHEPQKARPLQWNWISTIPIRSLVGSFFSTPSYVYQSSFQTSLQGKRLRGPIEASMRYLLHQWKMSTYK